MAITSKSNFYLWFYIPVPIIQFISWVVALWDIKKNRFSLEEKDIEYSLSCENIFYCCTIRNKNLEEEEEEDEQVERRAAKKDLYIKKNKERPITRWVSVMLFLFLYSTPVGLKSQIGYDDKVGAPTNWSSCTTDLGQTKTPYNPKGWFGRNRVYTDYYVGKFCVLDQTYGYPSIENYVIGYITSPLSSSGYIQCPRALPPYPKIPPRQNVNGYVDTYYCNGSYPSPVLGVIPIIDENTFGKPYTLCPGNEAVTICVSPVTGFAYYPQGDDTCPDNKYIGVPKKICPVCLNWWRSLSGDIYGPKGYEHCQPFIPQTWIVDMFCNFCPGRGAIPGYWLNDELFDQDTMLTNLVICSIIEGSFILQWICLFIVFKNGYKEEKTKE